MSFNILKTGASALTAAQRAVETSAHNAANSTSPGYTRQRVTTGATVAAQGTDGVLGSGHRGTGVQVLSIDRMRDVLGDLAVRAEEGAAGAAQVRAEVLDRAQGILGVYGSGVSESLSKMFAAFDQLALTPNTPAARQLVLEQAQSFANGLNEAASTLDRIRSDATAQAGAEVTRINDLAAEVANLNKHIVAALNGGQSPNDLLDRRDLLIDDLARLAGATVRQSEDGSVNVRMGGFVLVQGATAIPVELKLPEEGTDLVLLMQDQPVKAGGQIGARVEVLAKDLRTIEAQLDDVARAVAQGVNEVHKEGQYADGQSGQGFFAGEPTSGRVTAGTLRLDPTLTVDRLAVAYVGEAGSGEATTFSPLNGENALRLADLRRTGIELVHVVAGKEVRTTSTPAEWLNRVTSTLASGASAALAAAETTEISVTSLRAQRESANGVSIDEEMIELVKFQHSYDAAARVISIADEMLNTLINGMGAGR